jgi:serine/threonine-protein kinase
MLKPHQKDDVIKDRYKVHRVIGQGGMGRVYLARDLRLEGRLCAIKSVHYDQSLPIEVVKQTREQFEREATVLARLDHPNLPKVSDFFSETERDYLVMDFVPGKDLRELMNESKRQGEFLKERDVLSWANQIAEALNYLHEQDPIILHRDIKPSNIKLTPGGIIKLVDFGLVKLLISGEKTITVVQGHGSAYYTPLEQYGGDTGHTDPRSDVYSFGATLYHLLTNEPPLEARERFLNPTGNPSVLELNKSISPRTARAVEMALRVHPDQRLQSVQELQQALIGDWDPKKYPGAPLPAPNIRDLLEPTGENLLAWGAALVLFLSLIVTLLQS